MTPGDIVKRILLFFVGGSLVVAVLRGFPVTDPNEWYPWGERQANAVEQWVKGWMGDVPVDDLPPVDSIIPNDKGGSGDGGSGDEVKSSSKDSDSAK